MPQLAFVLSPRQNWYLRELAETIRYELEQQDAPSSLHTDGFPEPRPDLVYVLVAPHEYGVLEGALPDDEVLGRTIFVCAQPPSAIDLDEDQDLLRRAGAVFDLDARSVALHRRAGIPAHHLSPGYSKLRDTFDSEAERSIDVMFLGAHSLRRTQQLRRCARTLAPRNCLLQISDDSRPNPGGSPSFIAEGKWDLLKRTKILLNLHRGEDTYLEWLRVLDAIHSGAVVVTEHSSGMSPLVPGDHLLVASPESLPFVLDAALHDEELLKALRTSAYEHIRSSLPFALPVSVVRAAAVEIAGRPTPSSVTLHPWPARLTHGPAATPTTHAEADPMRLALKDVTLEVVRLRRDIARLEQIVRSASNSTRQSQPVYETPAWSVREMPRVTIVTVMCNCARLIRETLGSLEGSWFRDFELVIVDDASTDDSSEFVLEWMGAHPQTAGLLVRHPVGRGMGAARNTALEHARAEYFLALDPGDMVYPRCLEVLVGTLDRLAEPTFAYPMLEVFGATKPFVAAGGDYLLNVFGWEPRRLLQWSPVDAMAMIRTEQLRELDGFASEPDLSGWEDYDLWCRVADRDWTGQLVPQILGRHRASPARVNGLSEPPPVLALIDRSPRALTDAVPPHDVAHRER